MTDDAAQTRGPIRRVLVQIKQIVFRTLLGLRHFRDPHDWTFGICAVFKNESPYLQEWIEFHRLMGVDHFFLYDDASTDGYLDVLQPWIDQGVITLRSSEGMKQFDIYNHCLHNGARRCRWIAFIDLDEFLFSPEGTTLPVAMERYAGYPGVFVHWLLFGSNGHVQAPAGGVLENYTRTLGLSASIIDDFDHRGNGTRSDYVTGWARDGKSISDPRSVLEVGIHRPKRVTRKFPIDERFGPPLSKSKAGTEFSCEHLRINHYWSKSIEEFTAKIARGAISQADRRSHSLERSLERERMLNQVEDRLILDVRASLARSNNITT